jgi:hypothetical protein
VDPLTNFFLSFLCCVLLYVAGLVWIRLRGGDTASYISWLKWNAILCLWFTWPAFGLLLGVLFPDPNGGLLGGLL